MLYLLLYPLHKYYSGFNALRYETLRSVLAGLTALALSLALGPILIERFRELRIGQTIREVVPQAHQKKAGTPTMGGLLIVASMLSATLLLANLFNPYVWIAIFVTLTFGAIGFSDDYFKLARAKAWASAVRRSWCGHSRARSSRRRGCFCISASTRI